MYWKETWSNSWVPTFKMGTSDEERTPFNHLKHAYPGKKNFEDEFIWLQKPVNTPAKRDVSVPTHSSNVEKNPRRPLLTRTAS
jgi:hypothetical protein